ncbi:aminotransferase class V-fold PLP-dependent enzyme [Pedobacter foliorum]|uniref:aminotransferase class V-fold PLP-dependent enzyme n=1 Tax=Pedobacter foliorum TaxID=2739058 RepID=UPI001566E53B|nr:aminotransferase class V-fold PLP-dependent enzyme [Pedobacter foliorum]NRF37389.1 aminotransferase class V-fold PLP-dependent enzyme [Pedobacter foliorum]
MDLAKQFTLPKNSIFTHAEIETFRNETPGCRSVVHLNNAGAALMPEVVIKAQVDHIMLEAVKGGYEASALKADAIRGFYEQAALLLNCTPSNIAFTSSATDSYSRALSSILFKAGDIILTDNDDFVSNQIQFLSLQKRLGIKIIHINNAKEGGVDLNDLQEKLKLHRPKLLAITYIPTNSGLMQPVDDIAKIYRDYLQNAGDKTWYILDACQVVGQMKLDVQKLGCDFLSFTGRKFLRGPRGTGVLYISNDALKAGLEPMFIDMHGAEWTNLDSYKQQPDAKRFEDWEFAYSTVIGTMEAIKYCRHIGEDKIWQQVKLLSGMLRKELAGIDNVKILDRGPMQGGLVTFNIADANPNHIVSELTKRKINVVASYRAYGLIDFDEKGVKWVIRASPHYYNSLDEIEYFTAALKEIIKTK